MKENESMEEITHDEPTEKLNKLFEGLSNAVSSAIKEDIDSETIAKSVLHFAFMTNGQLADDYKLALKTAAEVLAFSSEQVKEVLEENSVEQRQDQKAEAVPEGITLH